MMIERSAGFLLILAASGAALSGCGNGTSRTETDSSPLGTERPSVSPDPRAEAEASATTSNVVTTGPTGTATAPSPGSIKVFLIDDHGQALTPSVPGMVSYRSQPGGNGSPPAAAPWSTPVTLSNQRTVPDFTTRLAGTINNVGPSDLVELGVYPPLGYTVQIIQQFTSNCDWATTFVPYGNQYQYYADSYHYQYGATSTLTVPGPASGSTCIAFKFIDDSTTLGAFEKLDTTYGKYAQSAFSSAMGVDNIPNNIVSTLSSSNTNNSAVSIQVSTTVGGVIQTLNLQKDSTHPVIQLINNNDIADSGMQWTTLVRGVTLPSTMTHGTTAPSILSGLAVNQAVGADPTWMWGMAVPLVAYSPPSTVGMALQSPTALWTPLYTDSNTDQAVADQNSTTTFSPRSPLYAPQSLHLFDGRVDDVSISQVSVAGGHTISQINSSFHSRSHMLSPFTAANTSPLGSLVRLEWISLNRDALVTHNAQVYYAQNGVRTLIGSLSVSSQNAPTGSWNPKSCASASGTIPCGGSFPISSTNPASSVSIVLDPMTPLEQVVSIHLPDFASFAASLSFTPRIVGLSNSTLLIPVIFYDVSKSASGNTEVVDASYDVVDSIQVSIGSNSDLQAVNPGMGR